MAPRATEIVSSKTFDELKLVLEAYAVKCGEMAAKLGSDEIPTDGMVTVRKGMFTLRNIFSRELGRRSIAEPAVVATWQPPKKKQPSKLSANEKKQVADARSSKTKSKRNNDSK
jgi:hypothetical protein